MYADPFAELQGRKSDITTPAPSIPVLPIMPSISGTDSSFPVSEEAFPVEGENAFVADIDANTNTADSQQVEISSDQPYSIDSFNQQATELDLQAHETYESHYTVTEHAYGYEGAQRQELYAEESHETHKRIESHVEHHVDLHVNDDEDISVPQDETIQMDQRHDEPEIRMESRDHYTSGAHTVEDPAAEFIELLLSLHHDSELSVVNRLIAHAITLDIAREDPVTRTSFCEAIELVTFRNKFAGQEFINAMEVMLDCLTQACTLPDSDEDRKTAVVSLGALWNLTFTEEQPVDVAKLATCARNAMDTFSYDSVALINATGLLVNLVCMEQGRYEILNLGLPDIVLSAINTHPADPQLLEHACQLFAILSSNESRSKLSPTTCASAIKASELSADRSVLRWHRLLKRMAAP